MRKKIRGHYDSDIRAILLYAAAKNGNWIPLKELEANLGIPGRTLRRIFQIAYNGKLDSTHYAYTKVAPIAFQTIATDCCIEYKIRKAKTKTSHFPGIDFRYEIGAVKRMPEERWEDPPDYLKYFPTETSI